MSQILNAKGVVSEVKNTGRQTKNGNPICNFKMNGQQFTLFDALTFEAGAEVEFQYTESQNGQYTNRAVKGRVNVVGQGNVAPAQATPPAPKRSYPPRQQAAGGSLEAALKGKDIKDVEQEILNLPYKESRTLQAAFNDMERQKTIVAQSSLSSAAQVTDAALTSGVLKLKSAELTSYVEEMAKTFAKGIVAGDYYSDPDFPKEEATGGAEDFKKEPQPVEEFKDDNIPF